MINKTTKEGKTMKAQNTYSVYVNEPLYTGSHPCKAQGVTINEAIRAIYNARKSYLADREMNESHGYILWDQAPKTDYAWDDQVFNMHFDSPTCLPNWATKREIATNRKTLETAAHA
jgi:hypothetical protein